MHGVDRRGVTGIATGLDILRDQRSDLIDGKRAASNSAVADEHAVRQRKTKELFHDMISFLSEPEFRCPRLPKLLMTRLCRPSFYFPLFLPVGFGFVLANTPWA